MILVCPPVRAVTSRRAAASLRRAALVTATAIGLASCHDSTDPGARELTGTYVARTIAADSLPVMVRCAIGGCTYLTEMQLRFRTRGRLLDVRRFRSVSTVGDTVGGTDYGDAFAYRLFGRDSIEVIRPFADTAYADSGVVRGDTILLEVRKLEQQFGGLGSSSRWLVRLVREVTP